MTVILAAWRVGLLDLIFAACAIRGVFLNLVFFSNKLKRWRALTLASHSLARCICAVLNIRFKIIGERRPAPGALIVANHVGAPDILILGSCFQTFFVARRDFGAWPGLGNFIRLGATLLIDRQRKRELKALNREVEERLALGQSVVVFPEGGVSDGTDVQPFKSSPFQAAIAAGRPVLPVAIQYHDPNKPSVACWHEISFREHVSRLLRRPRLEATVHILAPLEGSTDRRYLAEESRRRVREARQAPGGRV